MSTNYNDKAFPSIVDYEGLPAHTCVEVGITKREYFAAMAMQGLLANAQYYQAVSRGNPNYYSNKAVEVADALIAELNKEGGQQ